MALMSVAEASARVLAEATPLPAELVPLAEAHGRVLTADLAALRTQPPEAVSAMDGYAVRSADVANTPVRLKVVGEVAAGHPFAGAVGIGDAARIFTGGVLPPGTDTIVIQENAVRDGGTVLVNAGAGKGKHVRVAGLDFARGAILLRTGRRLSDRDVALAAAMNHPAVPVHRRPKVAVLATGDELVMPGTNPGPGEIVYSNGFATMALARREGSDVLDLGIVPDRIDETISAVRRARAANADILVTSGGASVGDHDLVQKALASEETRALVLARGDAARTAGDARAAREHARAWPARESGFGLCVCDPVYGPADPSAGRTAGGRRAAGSRGARRRLARQ